MGWREVVGRVRVGGVSCEEAMGLFDDVEMVLLTMNIPAVFSW